MKKNITFISLAMVLALFSTFSTLANNQVTDAQIYQLLDKSGATRTIEGLPMQMQAMGQQMALTAKDPADHKKFMEVFVSSLNPDSMLQTMADNIKSNISQKDMNDILTWLDTDLAKRMVNAELKAAEPAFQQNFMKFMSEIQVSPPSAERTQAVIGYVESSGIVDQSLNMILAMVKNMFNAVKASNPDNTEIAAQLDMQLEQMATTMKPALEQQMVLTSYYIYKDIGNEDLAKYSEFYQQDVGKKYLSTVVDAISEAMSDWGTNLITSIEKEHK